MNKLSDHSNFRNLFGAALGCALTFASSTGAMAAEKDDAIFVQRTLNRMGYSLGRIDGSFGPASKKMLAAFFEAKGLSAEANLTDDTLALFKAQPEVTAADAYVPKSGAELENLSTDNFFPPPGHLIMGKIVNGGTGTPVDIDVDGDTDLIYVGSVRAKNYDSMGETQGGVCGTERCEGVRFPPFVMINDGTNKFTQQPAAFVDERPDPGISSAHRLLLADYNRDGLLDMYVTDYGYGTHKGYRDNYYLSNGPLRWAESTETHLDPPGIVNFDHGGATGDIDGDGDIDIILTTLKNKASVLCLFNDGSGVLSRSDCTVPIKGAGSLELGDMDNDGDLDLVVGGSEIEKTETALILENDGLGRFRRGTQLPLVGQEYGAMPELSVWDLDVDGDQDIVISRVGWLYVGTAIQLIENRPEGFKSTLIEVVDAPDDYEPVYEGNEWNNHIHTFRFSDVNNDAKPDVILINGDTPGWPNYDTVAGAVLENQGSFTFKLVSKHPGMVWLDAGKFEVTEGLLDQSLTYSAGEVKDTKYSRGFAKSAKKLGVESLSDDQQATFTPLAVPMGLARSGASVLGYRNWGRKSYLPNEVRFELLISYGGLTLPFGACLEYYPQNIYTGAQADLSTATLGGAFANLSEEEIPCRFEATEPGATEGELGERADDLGVFALLYDIQNLRHELLQAFIDVPEDERKALIEKFE